MINYNPEELKVGNTDFQPIPEGDYEVIIETAGFKINQNSGKEYIGFTVVVRDDIEQDFKRRKVFDNCYPLKVGGQNDNRLFGMLGACKRPTTDYKDYNELLADLEGQYCQAHVFIDEYNGKKSNKVKFYHSTNFPAQTMETTEEKGFNVNVIDDELPF